eukprot:TRINITY_DN51980_c0_g1_i1.p1 TRINITY_DN51980_c0_g1~~TRINITY_DN51980_c0_g1_i1.p1  ORF type:complete len:346 (-),score=52.92 TRINITY_DN51980_c0_g1_i1:42-1079(-)
MVSPSDAAFTLPAEELHVQKIQVKPAECVDRRYILDGYECVSWHGRVLDGYNIDFSVKVFTGARRSEVQCLGRRVGLVGVHKCRVVSEVERVTEFDGFLDLGAEHAGCLGELGRTAAEDTSHEFELSFQFDNNFSYFAAKKVELNLHKIEGAAPYPDSFASKIRSFKAGAQWQRTARLLNRMYDIGLRPNANTYSAAMEVFCAARRWGTVLKLLEDMRWSNVAPCERCLVAAVEASEAEGKADLALRLMDEMSGIAALNTDESDNVSKEDALLKAEAAESRQQNLESVKVQLEESLSTCPRDAHELRGHIRRAQACLEQLLVGGVDRGLGREAGWGFRSSVLQGL